MLIFDIKNKGVVRKIPFRPIHYFRSILYNLHLKINFHILFYLIIKQIAIKNQRYI